MSDLTSCNYCELRAIRRRAKEDGKRVKVVVGGIRDKLSRLVGLGWDVLVYPRDEKPDREKHRVAWMCEITDKCDC